LKLFRAAQYYETHEEWELAWRAAAKEEKDFYQGMVHLTVALYQAGRGNQRAALSQIAKAHRRLSRYHPQHHGVNLEALVPAVDAAVRRVLAGEDIRQFRFEV
jgi:predicted metal-dependent hydrolase